MARREQIYVVDTEGRDKGKAFFLREMACSEGEVWAISVLTAMGQSGVEIDEEVFAEGIAGLARFGINGIMKVRTDLLIPLLDQMMGCVQFIPDPKRTDIRRALIEDDIEEIATRLMLRKEILTLHLGFFSNAGPST